MQNSYTPDEFRSKIALLSIPSNRPEGERSEEKMARIAKSKNSHQFDKAMSLDIKTYFNRITKNVDKFKVIFLKKEH